MAWPPAGWPKALLAPMQAAATASARPAGRKPAPAGPTPRLRLLLRANNEPARPFAGTEPVISVLSSLLFTDALSGSGLRGHRRLPVGSRDICSIDVFKGSTALPHAQ